MITVDLVTWKGKDGVRGGGTQGTLQQSWTGWTTAKATPQKPYEGARGSGKILLGGLVGCTQRGQGLV